MHIAKGTGASVIFAQHLEESELEGNLMPGHDVLLGAAAAEGVTVIQLGPAKRAARDAGLKPYHDPIHLTPAGQKVMADTLLPAVLDALKPRSG